MSDRVWLNRADLDEIEAQAEADGKEIERLETAVSSAAGLLNHLICTGQVTDEDHIAEIDVWMDRYVPDEE